MEEATHELKEAPAANSCNAVAAPLLPEAQAAISSNAAAARETSHLVKGKLVNVISRTWPGINKPGGIGKITKVYPEDSTLIVKCVDVKYIVHGGTDKAIPIEFIQPHEDDGNKKRNSSFIRRCTRCKSFVSDCLNCDLRYEAEEELRRQREEEERRRREEKMADNFRNKGIDNHDEDDDDDDRSMDSEEEEAHIASIRKRYRKLCKEAKRRSSIKHSNPRKQLKLKKTEQQEGREEEAKTNSNRDEENDLTKALTKMKKKTKKKVLQKNRRKLLQNPSVLASLSLSTNDIETSSVHVSGKSANDSSIENGVDGPNPSCDDEEVGFKFTAENDDEIPVAMDTNDDNDSSENGSSDDDLDDCSENVNNFEMDDVQAAQSNSGGSDDSDDDYDVKVTDLRHRDETVVGNKDYEQDEINIIIDNLTTTTIRYACSELSRLQGVLTELKRNMAKDDCLDELNELEKEGDVLHKYIIKELIRNGVDKCNNAMRRLTKTKRSMTARMSKSDRIRYNRQIEGLDLKADALGKRVEEIDNNVTTFQKEVDKVLEVAENSLHSFSFESTTNLHNTVDDVKRRMRNSSEKEWDPHQHSSHKRKSSSKQLSSGNKRTMKTNQSGKGNNNESFTQQRERTPHINQNQVFQDSYRNQNRILSYNEDAVEFDESLDIEVESRDSDNGATVYHIDNDSIGETDDLDNGPAMRDITRSWQTSAKSGPKDSSGIRRTPSNRRPKDRTPTYRHIQREVNSERVPSTTKSTGIRPWQSQAQIEGVNRAGANKSRSRELQRIVPSHPTQNNLTERTSGRSSTSASSRGESTVQYFLRPEILFNSLPTSSPRDYTQTRRPGFFNPTSSGAGSTSDSRSLHEVCSSLEGSCPQNLEACRKTLSALSKSAPHEDEEVITLFQTLHTLLKVKCSTLLDLLNCDPQMAYFQIDCWSLVFYLMEQKFHNQLQQGDILWKVFGKSSVLARHILLQIVDVLYSQLLGDGYGDAPRLTAQMFSRIRLLCRQIGAVVPLLPELPDLFKVLPGQLWYSSLIYDHKENTFEKSMYVSMLDPKIHERFIMEGEVVMTDRKSRLALKNIPRKEINALWTTIGFFTDVSPLPSKEKEEKVARFVKSLFETPCGVLPRNLKNTGIPASESHLDRCLHEMRWLCQLLSKPMLGNLRFEDSFVPGIVQRAVLLESNSVIIHMRPTAPQQKMDSLMRQLWVSSSLGSSDLNLDGLLSFTSLFMQNKIDDTWCFVPSTSLMQTCARLLESYAINASGSATKAHWNNYARKVDQLAATLVAKEVDKEENTEPKSVEVNDVGASFAHLSPVLARFGEIDAAACPTGAYLREAACFSKLACVIAGSKSHAFIPTASVALNKRFREMITFLSSDKHMQERHKNYLEGLQGDAPGGTSNIHLLFISSKILSLTALLHLSVNNESVEKLGLDDDTSMLEYLTTLIISNLSASIDFMESLNLSIKESRNLFNLSKSCTHVIQSTALWLGLIFHRATVVISNVDYFTLAANKMSVLHAAVKKLVESRSSLVVHVLAKALSILSDTAKINKLGKSLNVDLALDKAFLCCLGAIRKVIGLIHAYTKFERSNSNIQNLSAVFSEYQDFMASKVIPTSIENKKSDVQDLYRRQSVGLLCVLVALSSTCAFPQSLYHDMFRQRKQDDDSQLIQHLRTSFSCELTRLAARGFLKCQALAMQHSGDILNDIIVSMFDYVAIKVYPTCNVALLLQLGGEYSSRKGAKKLEKSQISSFNTDSDGFGYDRENLWSWCEDIGRLFCNGEDVLTEGDKKFWINSVGQAFQSACAMVHIYYEDGEAPSLVKRASAEKECDERRQLLRSVFASMRRKNLSFGDLPGIKDGNICSIAGCITKNLFYLSKTVSYYEEQLRWGCEDDDSRYNRAEIRAYEEAYIGFCGSVLSDLLKEDGNWVHIVKDIIVKRLEAPRVDSTEKELIVKLLSRVFEIYSEDLSDAQDGLGKKKETLGAYSSILHTLKTCFCDQLATRSESDAIIRHIFSCAFYVANLQIKTDDASTISFVSSSNDKGIKSKNLVYIREFTGWLKICGMIMLDEDLLPQLCELVAKMSSRNAVRMSNNEPSNPMLTRLSSAFDTLGSLEEILFRRTSNPYAKQSIPVGQRHMRRNNFKLSRACLSTIQGFIDKTHQND